MLNGDETGLDQRLPIPRYSGPRGMCACWCESVAFPPLCAKVTAPPAPAGPATAKSIVPMNVFGFQKPAHTLTRPSLLLYCCRHHHQHHCPQKKTQLSSSILCLCPLRTCVRHGASPTLPIIASLLDRPNAQTESVLWKGRQG